MCGVSGRRESGLVPLTRLIPLSKRRSRSAKGKTMFQVKIPNAEQVDLNRLWLNQVCAEEHEGVFRSRENMAVLVNTIVCEAKDI